MRTKTRTVAATLVRTTLELPDPLFARLKARAASERVSLKHLLHSYVGGRPASAGGSLRE